MDRGDEIIGTLLEICEKESIPSAVFSGIGGCQSAELQVFIPETGSFETERLDGMLELVSLNGNVVRDDNGQLFHHTHALFSFKKDGQHGMAGGHLKATTVLYTAEIELRPTVGGAIGRKFGAYTFIGYNIYEIYSRNNYSFDTTAVIAFPGRNYDSLPHRIKAQQILYDNLLERRATGTLSQYI